MELAIVARHALAFLERNGFLTTVVYGSGFAQFDVRAVETKSRYDETRQHNVAESQNVSVNGFLRCEVP